MQTITLPSKCDRAAASALVPEMCDALGDHPVAVDAAKVERIGQAMLQLLVSAARTEGGIALTNPSEPFAAAVRLAGLEPVLIEEAAQ
ncbi:MAG: STAS domain-containing protein [Erythrobacter sp.]|uniref:STAS domain-containing protein n=1 Tax=Erythrobacter sp. TaxID=1042 RepID=UPI0032ED5B53